MNWKHVCLTGSLATALLFTACDKDNDENDVNAQDQTFIVAASRSNRAEVELGTMALSKGTNNAVKMHAQMMVTEHTASQNELVGIHSNLDTDADINAALDAEQQAMRTTLMSLSGAAFDSAYIDGQIKGHIKTLAAFDAEISGGQNAQVKAFASSKRPAIQMHKEMADSIFVLVK